MTGLPAGIQVDIEFVAGTWTDVTADVDADQAIQLKFGRSSEFSGPQTATCSFTLTDMQGNYTPLNQGSIYYPNIRPRRRVRISIASGSNVRFIGYIQGFNPWFDGIRRVVQITANDRTDILSRRTLLSSPQQEIIGDLPTYYYPLSDTGNSAAMTFAEYLGRTAAVRMIVGAQVISGPVLGRAILGGITSPCGVWDTTTWTQFTGGTGTGGGTGGVTGLVGQGGYGAQLTGAVWSLCLGVQVYDQAWALANIDYFWGQSELNGSTSSALSLGNGVNTLTFNYPTGPSTNGLIFVSPVMTDTLPHVLHVVGTGTDVLLYLDGVLVGSGGAPAALTNVGWTTVAGAQFTAGSGIAGVYGWPNATMAHLSMWQGTALTATRVAAQSNAILNGFAGSTTGAEFSRILAYAGVAPSDVNAMVGVATISGYVTTGKTVAAAMQEMATTEGGGAASFIDDDGRARFNDRTYRNATSPAMTLDAIGDIDGNVFAPSYDQLTLVNDSTVTNSSTGYGSRYQDAASIAEFQISSDSATTFAQTDQAALNLAQDRVSRQSQPTLRFPQIQVDMITATTAGLYAALQNITIGSRLRVTGIPTTNVVNGTSYQIFPVSQVDLFVEGWAETIGIDQYSVTFDTSGADLPARMIYDDAVYGRWQADPGSLTLSGGIGTGTLTAVILTAGSSPSLTNAAGDLPMFLKIDEEVINVTAVSAATSPQTITFTRAQQGTTARLHGAGAVVTVYPKATWTL